MQWVTRSGRPVPVIGQGTWRMGEEASARAEEVAALREGIQRGLLLIDTAEAYADGESERVVADAVRGVRDDVFITTKVWPRHASRQGVVASLEASLRRLETEWVDLYLQHWPSREHPLEESVAGLLTCLDRGLARHVGVSNFPRDLLRQAMDLAGGRLVADQVHYSLAHRAPEHSLITWARTAGVTLMAYSPLKGVLADEGGTAALDRVAQRHGATRAAVALAWVVRAAAQPMVAIPKAARRDHVAENAAALGLTLGAEDVAELEAAFPPPAADMELRSF
jgi:diketogulonate reductase-like aldo/keto reductase